MAPTKRERRFRFLTPLIGMGIALVGGLGFGAIAVEPLLLRLSGSSTSLGAHQLQQVLAPVPQEVLLLGTDAEGLRTDVIASLHLTGEGAHLTQIPRDTFIRSSQHGEQKVNALYAFGGIKAISAGAEELIGRPMPHYIVLNLETLRELGDALGGLEMTVAKQMRYSDRSQNLEIDLLPGHQRLRGRALEGYLRFRNDGEGDLGRMRRQRQAVDALMGQLATAEAMAKLPQLLRIANDNIKTNLNLFQLAGLAKVVAGQQLSASSLPGYLGYRNGISYWFVTNPERSL
ncbi:cell envelope-related transcriptional attenuator domain-containing protein [Synechococcus sp. Minos11]|nr:MAG: hypothetical protein CBD45_07280 [Synechococcus sp. TMED185]QNJ09154.1 cell envelope-related transcriptional attenuator domain-containing protein [Synechococcus sp. Minos11]RCL63089.1 MAG: LytR family transcriptional regulator [Synechococcus sp. MED-G67]CAK28466.1 Possible membrane-bound transcriptional regulator [Synechococcus sp. RCC307]HCA61816.1 LytR family transcriptional regulator [Synechococcales bacterium UBA8647]HCV56054.1 LytR family transcriptional regulator [Synechococcales